jgi:hypothetical protein
VDTAKSEGVEVIRANMRITGDRVRKLNDLRKLLSPRLPESFPLTEVMLFCIDKAHEAEFGVKEGKSR